MRYLILFLCFFYSSYASGQILKVNKNNLNADSSNFWMGALSFNFDLNNRSVNEDNQNSFIGFTGATDLVYVSQQNAYILINNINYFTSSDKGGAFISTGYSHARVNWQRKKRLSAESYTQVQYDRGRNMPLRFLVGSGLRYRLIDTKEFLLVAGAGIMFENEKWKLPENESIEIRKNLWKSSNYLNGSFQFGDHTKLDVITYYQVGYDNGPDVFRNRINGDIVLNIQISNRFTFLTKFSAQYEDKPIIPINNMIYSLQNGFKYSF